MEITIKEWEAKGKELFGEDKQGWKFSCPACHNELSINDAKENHPDVKGKGWSPVSECIGRYTNKVDCDWCAYGLFCGPLMVKSEDGETSHAFDFAGLPFTGKKSN